MTTTLTPSNGSIETAPAALPQRPPMQRPPGRLPVQPRPPRKLAPRGKRWWAGVVLLVISLLLLCFVADAAVFSAQQYNRSQNLQYSKLRLELAQAQAPVGQLDLRGQLVTAGTPVALLKIPTLGLSEVVSEGTTADVLRSGPGHRRDSVMPGQAGTSVIMGRQTTYGGPFGTLKQLVPGDTITVTTGQGTNTFRVFGIRRDGDPAPEAPLAGSGRLELITADGLPLLPSGALHIDAELVGKVQTTPTLVMRYEALPVDEWAMGQDLNAWYTAFFVFAFFIGAGVALLWLWRRWGRRQVWLVGAPVLVVLAATLADAVLNALPNLI